MKNAVTRDRGRLKGLFVSDLDGTLLNDAKQIAPRDLATLARLRQMGISVALATGRSDFSFGLLLEKLAPLEPAGLPVDHIIFSTGAGIMDYPGRRLLQSFALVPEEVGFIVAVLDALMLDYMIHQPVPDTRHFLYRLREDSNADFLRRLQLYRAHAAPLSPDALAVSRGASGVLCIVAAEAGHQIARQLAETLSRFSVVKATSPLDGRSVWIEIFHPGVSKREAVKWLAGELGLLREQVCAVGNDYNDEDLLDWAGNGFAVANSPPPLLARFPAVASNNQAGVSEAAGRWLGL